MRGRLEESGELGHGETLRILARASRYLGPFKARFAAKLGLLVVSLLPILLLPWPVKILVDHVILGVPVEAPTTPYPAFLAPLVALLAGLEPTEIVVVVLAFQLFLIVLLGAVGTGGNERDQADAYLSGGHDQQTRTENESNAGFSMASGLLGLFDFRFTLRLTQDLNHHYRSRLFDRIQTLPMTAFDDERIGDAVFRVMYDTPSITNSVYRIVLTPVGALVLAAVTIAVLDLVYGGHPTIVWCALGILGVALVASLPFAAAIRRRSSRSRKAGATTTSTLEEGLTNMLAVQSLGGEGRERRRFDDDSWAGFSRFRQQLALGMGLTLVAFVPAFAIGAYAFWYISDLVITGKISLGDFGLLFSYFLVLTFACVEVGALWIRVQESAAGLDRVFFLMDLPGEEDAPGVHAFPPLAETVRIEHAAYAYPDGSVALRDVDLEARVGQVVAIVGPAGAGKTTLAYLIPRFLAPSAGRVLFDGADTAGATLASIRDQVAFVFQETVLFDATVEDNIRLGRPEASDPEIRRAAQLAGADAFVRKLPEGYRTRLGRAGGKLSVGQKQRLSIARALVRRARILILDEPTTALDPETEQVLVDSLREASRDRLVLVIAHRLSTIRSADQILFLADGAIVERGSHDELMARPDGAYRRFVSLQTLGAA
ncbi:MAG TPA: ABC transporter ATP-binding protein [Myxococcota bacterium]|nr:ABC transporter ATP-binding protein [Myxococcota bacterium]